LFYACAQRQYDAAVNELKFRNQVEHSDLLMKAAKKIGLDSPSNGFYPVSEGKLNDFLEGKAEMATVISIALLMAESDPSHPLHKIANMYQDFITRLFGIKKKRDMQGHGKGKVPKDVELPEEVFMREIVPVLLPDISFADKPVATVDKNSIADGMLDSRTSVQSEFDFKLFNRLGTDLLDKLIRTEDFWLSCSKDEDKTHEIDACVFAFDLYAALQAMFRKNLTELPPPDIDDSKFIEQSQTNARNAGLGELPKTLLTVKPRMIRQTLRGDDQSLGACAVAFLLVSSEESLDTISKIQPSFLSDVTDIIIKRGHGNEPLPISKKEIKELRKLTYSTIKTLLEV
jgi:hypothetical protein